MGASGRVGNYRPQRHGSTGKSIYEARTTSGSRDPTTITGTEVAPLRIGRNVEVKPVGGGKGCLVMILISVIASIVLTVLLNLVFR